MNCLARVISLLVIVVVILPSEDCSKDITRSNKPVSRTSPRVSSNQLPILPSIGDSFEDLGWNNKLYVDKTIFLKVLLTRGLRSWICLRPRRFGKSLFLQMARRFFSGDQDLFKGLNIYEDGNTIYFQNFKKIALKWTEFPVIYLDFGGIEFETFRDFQIQYMELLRSVAIEYHLDHSSMDTYTIASLINDLYAKFDKLPVMILIDEYDKPFRHAMYSMNDTELAKNIVEKIDVMLGIVKSFNKNVGFLFITGISRLCMAAMESGTNNIKDITFEPIFSEAFGFTCKEIVDYFKPYLNAFQIQKNEKSALQQLMEWYDGYRFDIKNNSATTIFNPVDTVLCFENMEFRNYWCKPMTSNLIAPLFYESEKKWCITDFYNPGYKVMASTIETNAMINPLTQYIEVSIWMLLHGYLTVRHYDSKSTMLYLTFPNREIQCYVIQCLSTYRPPINIQLPDNAVYNQLYHYLSQGFTESAIQIMRTHIFYDLTPDQTSPVHAVDIVRRFSRMLSDARMPYQPNVVFQQDDNPLNDAGDFDFLTTGLGINYVISIKCGSNNSAMNSLMQLTDYVRDNPKSFWKAANFHNTDRRNFLFLGLYFTYDKGGKLSEWICLPYVDRKPELQSISSEPGSLVHQFIAYIKDINTQPTHVSTS